jgi:hypothetical protein
MAESVMMGMGRRKYEGFLRVGTRAAEDIFTATVLSQILYEELPDRRECVICGQVLIKNIHYPCCSRECKSEYRDWLNETGIS